MTVTRFAPSPTGFLHLGHAFAALTARAMGKTFLLRIEDLDQGRARPAYEAAILEDLAWLELSWPEPVLRQSQRQDAYQSALQKLEAMGLVYPCFCTRKEIAEEIARAGEAPVAAADGPVYPGTCRHLTISERQTRIAQGQSHAMRLDVGDAARRIGPLSLREKNQTIAITPLLAGDIVLARKDMPAAYHLAVVVDDAYQGVSLVTRGEDLAPAAHVQRLLQALLGLPAPDYAHHRLILDAGGRKFSKRDQAPSLRAMRQAGVTPAGIRTQLGL